MDIDPSPGGGGRGAPVGDMGGAGGGGPNHKNQTISQSHKKVEEFLVIFHINYQELDHPEAQEVQEVREDLVESDFAQGLLI